MQFTRVRRPRWKAAEYYDRLQSFYDCIAGPFEWPKTKAGIDLLGPLPGETILEIGSGTGRALAEIARRIGTEGEVIGIDLSGKMVKAAKRRLREENLAERVLVKREDALTADIKTITGFSSFSGIFMSFTLELFDTEEIPLVLNKLKPLLKRSGGRLVVVSLEKRNSIPVRIYEAMHTLFPAAIDCRPIPVKELLINNGFKVLREKRDSITGLPVSIIGAGRLSE